MFLVWSPNSEMGWIEKPTKIHETYTEASKEAVRLSEENPDTQFYVLAAVSVTMTVVTKDTKTDVLKCFAPDNNLKVKGVI